MKTQTQTISAEKLWFTRVCKFDAAWNRCCCVDHWSCCSFRELCKMYVFGVLVAGISAICDMFGCMRATCVLCTCSLSLSMAAVLPYSSHSIGVPVVRNVAVDVRAVSYKRFCCSITNINMRTHITMNRVCASKQPAKRNILNSVIFLCGAR